jgi:hypothetical protein
MASAKSSKLENNYYDKLGIDNQQTLLTNQIRDKIKYELFAYTDKYAVDPEPGRVEFLNNMLDTVFKDDISRAAYDMSLMSKYSSLGLPDLPSDVHIKIDDSWKKARSYQVEAVEEFYRTNNTVNYNKNGYMFTLKREGINNALYLTRYDGTKSPIIDLNRIFIKITNKANIQWVIANPTQRDAYLARMYNESVNDDTTFNATDFKGKQYEFKIVNMGRGKMNMIRDSFPPTPITDNFIYIDELEHLQRAFTKTSGGAKVKKSKSKHIKRSRRSTKAKSNRKSRN